MKKSKMFVVSWELFPFDVLVCLGSNDDQIIKYMNRTTYKLTEEEKQGIKMSGVGRTVMLGGNQTILRIKHFPKKGDGVLAHEIFHVVDLLTYKLGIAYSNGNNAADELYAYMIQYLTNQINQHL